MTHRVSAFLRTSAALLVLSVLLGIPSPALAAAYTVNTTGDADDGSCDARNCSLREAVEAANENPGPDTITFNIPGAGPHVIHLGSWLRLYGDSTLIDGTTQPGYSTGPTRFGTPAVTVEAPEHPWEGRSGGGGEVFEVVSSGNTIHGLRLTTPGSFSGLVEIYGSNNLVEHNLIGLELDGRVNPPVGIWLHDGDSNAIRNNVIVARGIAVDIGAGSHIIQGNYIGLDPGGAVADDDLREGIRVEGAGTDDPTLYGGGFSGTLIGGDGPGEGNVISGCETGIITWGTDVQVIGNRIGTNPAGTAALSNGETGIEVLGDRIVIRSNLISGNPVGIRVGSTVGSHTFHGRDAMIEGNMIGTDLTGTAAIPNEKGIVLGPEVELIQIGGADPAQSNLVSGNGIGIEIQGGIPTILGNRIGTNAAGTSAIPNEYGIIVWERTIVLQIGGSAAGEGNLISGNTRTGLWLRADGGPVLGNRIGLTADGTSALPNGTGLDIDGDSNMIGGPEPGEGNVISGNENGVVVDGESNTLHGNFIGTDPSGSTAIPNAVGVFLGGDGNMLGAVGGSNMISGNGRGLVVTGSHNTVVDNRIGTDLTGAAELPNGTGIEVFGPYNQIGSRPGNLVMYNNGPGIRLSSLAVGNTISNNTIANNSQEGIRVEPGGGVARNTFSRNSMYDNAWLGIDLLPGAQADIAAPVIDSITIAGESTAGEVRGHACPGCTAELFLADPDLSGSGEGRTFYAAATAAAGGTFTISIPIGATIDICQPFTATATDAEGNTSEFSVNMTPFGCRRISWIVLVLGGLGLVIVGAGAGGLAGRPHGRPGLGAAAGGASGGLVGVVIVVVLASLPSVQIVGPHLPAGGGSPAAPAPPCAQFINPSQLRPENGAVFDLGTDVLFELSPQPDPPGVQTRWTLHLSGPAGLEVAELLSAPSASLSSVGVDEPAPGTYLWRLSAERLDGSTGAWHPFCTDLADRAFLLLQPTPPAPPEAMALQPANCRSGPSLDYPVLDILAQGLSLPINGRNQQGGWWQVLDAQIQLNCWLAGGVIDITGDTSDVPVIAVAPPPPAPTDTHVPAAPVNCGQYNSNTCSSHPACQWDPKSGTCKNK